MKHKAALTISRPSYSDGRKKFSISLKDVDARVQFLNIEIDYDKFAECITGISECECEMEFRGLENVGKKIERDQIEFEVYKWYYKSNDPELIRLAEEATPKGWICSAHFGSQDSFFKKDDKYYARTSISRWIEKEK